MSYDHLIILVVLMFLTGCTITMVHLIRDIRRLTVEGNLGMRAIVESLNRLNERIRRGE